MTELQPNQPCLPTNSRNVHCQALVCVRPNILNDSFRKDRGIKAVRGEKKKKSEAVTVTIDAVSCWIPSLWAMSDLNSADAVCCLFWNFIAKMHVALKLEVVELY